MIPKSTTLAERLEFYEYCLDFITEQKGSYFLCHIGFDFYNYNRFGNNTIKRLFPEVYKYRDKENSYALWQINAERIEALQKAIIEVKRKIEEE